MNKIYVACAGSGKTTTIIYDSMKYQNKKILITTFTDNNVEEIKSKFYKINGSIPSNVTILPWFTFQLKHLIKPYLIPLLGKEISGICMINGNSTQYISETKKEYYLNSQNKIYSDKIPKLSSKMLSTDDLTINRLLRLYDVIFIDEFQDFSGYDLEVIESLMNSSLEILLYCDPRQHTFSTNHAMKNKKYRLCSLDYIKNNCNKYCAIDTKTLNGSYRCPEKSIVFASLIFSEYDTSHSNKEYDENDGIFFVEKSKVNEFLEKEKPLQLRDSVRQKVDDNYYVLNFGASKGLTRENVLIYPTTPMKNALKTLDFSILQPGSKSDLYVALTRAKHKTGIIIEDGKVKDYQKAIDYLDKIQSCNVKED